MENTKKTVAIIPARGGSRSVYKKNIKLLGGKPLIWYTIKAALKSKYIDRVIVSTDDEEIAKVAKECGAEIPFLQSSETAQYESSALSALLGALNHLETKDNYFPEVIVYLQPTSPFRTSEHIDKAVQKLLEDETLDGVFGATEVNQHPYLTFEMMENEDPKHLYDKEERSFRRQDLPKRYITNASLYVTRRKYFHNIEEPKPVCPILKGKVKPIIMNRESSLDINDLIDFHIGETILKSKNEEKQILIGNKKLGKDNKTFVIAEMAGGHNGSLTNAKQLIDIAAESGADAIKLHIYNVEECMISTHKLYTKIKDLEFNKEEWEKLICYAKERGLKVISVPGDMKSVEGLSETDIDSYFIYPACIDDLEMIKKIAQLKKPIFLQLGGIKINEAERAIEEIKNHGNDDIILVHGFQAFPTKLEDIKLNQLKLFKDRFNLPVALEDHTDGHTKFASIIPLLGLPYEVHAIIKHFTINRALKLIDHESALNPDELKTFIEDLREVEMALGKKEFSKFSEDEKEYRNYVKKRVVAKNNILRGRIITEEDISFKRANEGISSSNKKLIIGKKANKEISKNSSINLNDFE